MNVAVEIRTDIIKKIILSDIPINATFLDIYYIINPMFGNIGCILLLGGNIVDYNQLLLDAKIQYYASITAISANLMKNNMGNVIPGN
jgi:hypothetical protein